MRGISANQRDDDLVTGRGPVSGTGKPLSDDVALAILDERVHDQSRSTPEIGVVIEPSPTETDPAPGQQRLGLGKEVEALDQPLHSLEDLHFGPGAVAMPWSETGEMFGRSAHHRVVKADLMTPVITLIDRSCEFSAKALRTYKFDSGILLRLVIDDSMIDVPVTLQDLEEPDLTVRDLLAKTVPRP
jgi:hypothetical protein